MTEQQIPIAAGSILYDASGPLKPDDGFFTREYWAKLGGLAEIPGGRGRVLFVRDGDRRWVVRHYQRGGFIARFVDDAFLWTGADRTRSFREWRILAALHGEGFPVPLPIAARYIRKGLIYRADLITGEIEGSRTLADSITLGEVPLKVWRHLGGVIARLHHRGVHHADLNAHNVLIDREQHVHVIDFDRARIRARGGWEIQVLARLRRSLDKIMRQREQARFSEDEWQALLRGYGDEGGS